MTPQAAGLSAGPHPADRPLGRRWTWPVAIEPLLLVISAYWAVFANRPFFAAAAQAQGRYSPGFVAAGVVGLTALHFLLLALPLAPLTARRTVKPVLALLTVVTALAAHYMQRLGVYLDPTMLRNVLRTDVHEARELLHPALLPQLLWHAALPLLLLWRARIVPRRGWRHALLWRGGSLLAAVAVLAASMLAVFQPLASLMRNHKEARYLVTPANLLWSLASVAGVDARTAAGPRRPLGLDARLGPDAAARRRPLVVVMVVGETARAASWGLSGHARQTTPELARLPGVVNFADVASCGTNTEVSLPCLFAPVGRRDYDEARIRGGETLLDVLQRAGVGVRWVDNQSGCKGVCDRVPHEQVQKTDAPASCPQEHCYDEALLSGVDHWLAPAPGPQATRLVVLHPLGNHGPAYFRRYPPAYARFQPACEQDDLQRCTRQEIVNAYDNALLYTDHLLATLIGRLQAASGQVDSALVYVSDHGESLGENGLYLHGLPYAIAPDVQKRVPMVMWFSPGFPAATGVDAGCLRERASRPVSHDHLFHTLLGLLGVETAVHEAAWDLTGACRRAAPAAQAGPATP